MTRFEALLRPAVMLVLVTMQSVLALMWAAGIWPEAKDAFAGLGAFTMMVVTWLFKTRDEEKRAERGSGG